MPIKDISKECFLTSDVLTGSSTCKVFRISATFVEALPLAFIFGITPKEN